jgi:hypothetical protein
MKKNLFISLSIYWHVSIPKSRIEFRLKFVAGRSQYKLDEPHIYLYCCPKDKASYKKTIRNIKIKVQGLYTTHFSIVEMFQ